MKAESQQQRMAGFERHFWQPSYPVPVLKAGATTVRCSKPQLAFLHFQRQKLLSLSGQLGSVFSNPCRVLDTFRYL